MSSSEGRMTLRERIIEVLYGHEWENIATGDKYGMAYSTAKRLAEAILAVIADDIEMNHDQDEYRFIVEYLRGLLDN